MVGLERALNLFLKRLNGFVLRSKVLDKDFPIVNHTSVAVLNLCK